MTCVQASGWEYWVRFGQVCWLGCMCGHQSCMIFWCDRYYFKWLCIGDNRILKKNPDCV